MALIGQIRERSWILIVLIGLAMAGFIFMDMFSGKQSILSGRQLSLGEVNGKEISQPDFERAYSALYTNSAGDVNQQRANLWNFFVEDNLIRSEARQIGLSVPTEEMEDLQWGTNLSPIVSSRFRDQNTGQVNRTNLNSYRDAERDGSINDETKVAPAQRNFWMFQQREISKQRLQDKLASLVAKSMYTPDWMAEEIAKGQNTRVDIAYVKIPYDAIPDASVQVADADYDAYLAANGYLFKRNSPSRELAYVAFNVKPTPADSADYRKQLNDKIELWKNAPDDSVFVAQQRGLYATTYYKDDQLPPAVRGAETGTIVGPYVDGNNYVITKIVDRKVIPDSVESRHILLPGKTQAELSRSIALADSIENLIKTGVNTFAEMAQQFSTGPTGPNGGDLGYVAQGTMVPEFNDLIFFTAKKGELNRTLTQFGLHIVEVTGTKTLGNTESTRVASIQQQIIPSAKTQKAVYEEAARFAQTNRTVEALKAAADANPSLNYEEGNVVSENDFIVGSLGSSTASRDMIKYAFTESPGTVSPNVYPFKATDGFYDGKYVVTAVTGASEAGIPTGSIGRALVKDQVLQEKKAAIVASAGSDLSSVASRYNVQLDTASAVNFAAAFIPNIGSEPKVLAKAFSLPQGQASGAIAGSDAIFMIKPLVRTEPGDISASIANVRRSQAVQLNASVRNGFGTALRQSAEIEDGRSRFY